MAIDSLRDTQKLPESESRSQSHPAQHDGKQQSSTQGRWWKRGLFAIGVIAVLAMAAALIRGALSSRENDRAIAILESMRLIAPGQFELIEELTMLELEGDRVSAATGRLEDYLESDLSDPAPAEALLRRIRNMLN